MKTVKLKIALIWLVTGLFIWSCNDDTTVQPEIPQENLFATNILQNSSSAINRVRGLGFGGPLGAIYGNLSRSAIGGRSSDSPLALASKLGFHMNPDSTDLPPDCVIETWEEDDQGNYTYTLDFGDGCDYYGEYMVGKLVETGHYGDNSFSSSVAYTNFGGTDWSIDGTYSYSGTWEDNTDELPENSEDSASWEFTASYEFAADLTETYTEFGYDENGEVSTGEKIIVVDYVAEGNETMDQDGYTVESRTESVEVNTGESFNSQVDTPLHMDYSCQDVWIFVRGVESGSYTYEGATGSYSIDYGDGTCDNLILLTENGVTEEIDLGEEWDDWEDECGNDEHGG